MKLRRRILVFRTTLSLESPLVTCIVAIRNRKKKKVYIGADSASSNYWSINSSALQKVFRRADFLVGGAGSWRLISILQFSWTPPDHPKDMDLHVFMHTKFIDSVRDAFKEGGFLKITNEREEGGIFMVGYRGELFIIDSDFQVQHPVQDYRSIGSGMEVAHGSLYSTANIKSMSSKNRLILALSAASDHTPFVRPPFSVMEI